MGPNEAEEKEKVASPEHAKIAPYCPTKREQRNTFRPQVLTRIIDNAGVAEWKTRRSTNAPASRSVRNGIQSKEGSEPKSKPVAL